MNSLLAPCTLLRLLLAGAGLAHCRQVEDRPRHRSVRGVFNRLLGRELAHAGTSLRRSLRRNAGASLQRNASVGSHSWLGRRGAAASPPNILYILADDLGYADVGYHSDGVMKTPRIDELASQGVKLENFYANPVCSATRASLLTGRYTHRLGFQHFNPPKAIGGVGAVPLKEKLLPQYLKEAGYATHIVGKWHAGMIKEAYVPTHRGFDTHFGFYEGGIQYYNHTIGGHPDMHWEEAGKEMQCTGQFKGTYDIELFTRRAGKIIDDHDVSKPLFLYLAYHNPHTPNACPKKYYDMYPEETSSNFRRVFCGQVSAMDTAVGITVAQWKAKGDQFWKDSIIVFHSDNGGPTYEKGGAKNYPLRGGKLGPFEGGTRVVSFVVSPLIAADMVGKTATGLMHVTDMLPTLVGRTGVKVADHPLALDGIDQWDAISTGAPSKRTTIVHMLDPLGNGELGEKGPEIIGCETSGPFFGRQGKCQLSAAIRSNDGDEEWKLIVGMWASCLADATRYKPCSRFNYDGEADAANPTFGQDHMAEVTDADGNVLPAALFNIKGDPGEKNNVASTHPHVVEKLMGLILDEAKTEVMEPQWPPYRVCDTPCGSCAFRPDLYVTAVYLKGCSGPFIHSLLPVSPMSCVEPVINLPLGTGLGDFWE